ncbi:MAG: hypothetical protein U0175_07850 [Caldilineaceae bacterium]
MIHLASFQNQLRLWLHLSIGQPTRRSAQQQFQTLADQDAIQRHHLALHRACKRLALRHPEWVQRRFDEEFLCQMSSGPVLPTGPELAAAWDRRFGLLSTPSVRCQQMAQLVSVANHFLACYEQEQLS